MSKTEPRETPTHMRLPQWFREYLLARYGEGAGPHARDWGAAARQVLDDYRYLMERSRDQLKDQLAPDERALVVDVLNGTFLDTATTQYLWAEVEDAIKLDGVDAKWKVDGPALVAKLRALHPASLFALADAVRIFWQRVGAGEQPDPRKLLEE